MYLYTFVSGTELKNHDFPLNQKNLPKFQGLVFINLMYTNPFQLFYLDQSNLKSEFFQLNLSQRAKLST